MRKGLCRISVMLKALLAILKLVVLTAKTTFLPLPDLLKDEWFIGNDKGLVNLGKGKNVANTRTLYAIACQLCLVGKMWQKIHIKRINYGNK
jgi:hypothetical protein